ncbi:hypothetical protein ACSHWD_00020 [Aerococcus urinaeequi]
MIAVYTDYTVKIVGQLSCDCKDPENPTTSVESENPKDLITTHEGKTEKT